MECSLETLESRLMLSIAPVAQPEFAIYHPIGVVRPMNTAAPTGLTPAQIRQAYNIDEVSFAALAGAGAGQTIAIVDAYNAPTIAADLRAFDVAFGLPDPILTVVGQTGSTTVLPAADTANRGNSWAVESSLDVEWVHAIAPYANILLVEANSASNSDLMAAVDIARNYPGVSVVSMSWGMSEFSGMSANDVHFTTPAGHIGVTFVASSGDSGAYAPNSRTRTVNYPAVSANVLSVGGTRLTIDAAGNYISESGWGNGTRSGTSGGSGGGLSRLVSQPAYQRGVVTQSSTARAVPDVAFDADPASGVPVYDSWDFGVVTPWSQVGGTSLSAPAWAGILAIANQGRALAGLPTLTGAQTLSSIYGLPASDFHDIITGNNGYAAGPGYDLVTGRGTPIVNLLVAGLIGGVVPSAPVPLIGTLTVNPASVQAGAPVTVTAGNVVESSGSSTITNVAFYLESNGVGGLQTAGDTSLGNGVRNGTTWSLAAQTAGMAPGSYSVYAIATDSAGVTGSVAAATLNILAPAPANDSFSNAAVLTGPTLTVAGSNVGATKESGEPNHAGNVGGKSVWYTWTATASGKVTVNTHGSSFDTTLGVYTGSSVSGLTAIASNDDDRAGGTLTSALTFNAVAGTTYRIAIDGYNGAAGNITLNLALAAAPVAPANDQFANAVNLSNARPVTWTGSNVGATKELGEPNHAGNRGGASVWIRWTAPVSGTVSVNTRGSNFDTTLAVYTGATVSSLTLVASNDDDRAGGTLTSALTFTAVAGRTYMIAVDGYNGATGSIVLNIA